MGVIRSILHRAFIFIDSIENMWLRVAVFFVGTLALFGVPWPFIFLFRSQLDTTASAWIVVSLILGYGAFVGILMFRMASWAGTVKPLPSVEPVGDTELRARLLAVNELDLPFHIIEDKKSRLIAEWRIADAKWAGLMEVGGLKFVHKINLELDAKNKRVSAQDREWKCSFRAGIGSLSMFGAFFAGIDFFSYDRAVEYGLLFKNGRLVFGAAYDYRFEHSEMKTPLINVIIGSGWTFRPVVTLIRMFN
jgi:hypothetical protein